MAARRRGAIRGIAGGGGPDGGRLVPLIQAAAARRETRGVHVRADYPATSDGWRRHLCWQRNRQTPWEQPVESAPVAAGQHPVLEAGDCRLAGSGKK
ncbi:MAG: hypothetical protein EBZ13_12375 [Planctomycetia bacterium]|nr:hypothetical protein [Planctomycetia bacterium]